MLWLAKMVPEFLKDLWHICVVALWVAFFLLIWMAV